MAITLINPRLSFLKFANPKPEWYSLPIKEANDLAFQVLIQTDTVEEANDFMTKDLFLRLVDKDAVITDQATLDAETLIDYALIPYSHEFQLFRIGEQQILLYWSHGLPDFDTVIDLEECFRLALIYYFENEDEEQVPVTFISNLFHRTDNVFSTFIEYACNEDAFGFYYCPDADIVNRVRVYMHISKPQFLDDESVYVKSNGVRKVLKSVNRKQLEVLTNLFDANFHEFLKMAIGHDIVSVKGKWYEGGIVKDGNFQIDWPNFIDFESAPAAFKLLATPYNFRNSNCEVCKTFGCDIEISAIVIEVSEPGPPVVYHATWTNSGGLPVSVDIQISLDGGDTWVNPTNGNQTDETNWFYDMEGEEPVAHLIRLTPICNTLLEGDPTIGEFTI